MHKLLKQSCSSESDCHLPRIYGSCTYALTTVEYFD